MKYIYIIRGGESQYKIGIAINVQRRLKGLQTSNANKLEVVAARLVEDAPKVERELHSALRKMRVPNGGREWFSLTPSQVIDLAIALNQHKEVDIADFIYDALRKQIGGIVSEFRLAVEEQAQLFQQQQVRRERPVTMRAIKPSAGEQLERDVNTAISIIQDKGKASTSMLQRHMGIGYGRAARIIDELERLAVISPQDGSSARDVLVA